MSLSSLPVFAHTLDSRPMDEWEPLYGDFGHSEKVKTYIKSFASPFHPEVRQQTDIILEILALYHDMGKASPEFQSYLKNGGNTVDHKTAAAKWIMCKWRGALGKILAIVLRAHHGGLTCGAHFMHENDFLAPIDSEILSSLPEEYRHIPEEPICRLAGRNARKADETIFSCMMAIRMLHSCLIDADWLATESFTSPDVAAARLNNTFLTISEMTRLLETHIKEREKASSGYINALRKEIHDSCFSAALTPPGVFRLNVPTGGGKTLSSLSFALAHAKQHNKQRVIYVIPYTSIIEQTAREFRNVFGDNSVVEHHCNLSDGNDSETNRFAAENWDAPLIVTTSVQFFESLFASKNQRCRKLHNIANSVIVLDEAQTIPAAYLKPCLYALKTLQRDFGCTVVLCTATQPTVVNDGYFDIGWSSEEVKSLMPIQLEMRLVNDMKRVEVENLGRLSVDSLIEHFLRGEEQSALFIVNLTRQAHELFSMLSGLNIEGLFHLSARMCPKHRADVLETVRCRLKEGLPTILVATRVVEAGVDISFPVVYRDQCGIDSLAQSAGRCNRHGEKLLGHVYFYEAEDSTIPPSFTDLRDGIYAMKDLMYESDYKDLLSTETVETYFKLFYNKRKRGCNNWDKKSIVSDSRDIEAWDFVAIAQDFRLIEQEQVNIVVPYCDDVEDLRAELHSLSVAGVMPCRKMFRRLSLYAVSVYKNEWMSLMEHCELVHKNAGIWFLVNKEVYDYHRGLLRATDVVLDYVF